MLEGWSEKEEKVEGELFFSFILLACSSDRPTAIIYLSCQHQVEDHRTGFNSANTDGKEECVGNYEIRGKMKKHGVGVRCTTSR